MEHWIRVNKSDPVACALADRHYSRRKIGAPQFMPPGQTIVLLRAEGFVTGDALFGWWRPDPSSGLQAMNRLDGWTCTIFRNESAVLSSELILAAEPAMSVFGYNVGPDGLLTYVWDAKVRHKRDPGRCFLKAGWHVCGRSADNRKTLLHKGDQLRGQPCECR